MREAARTACISIGGLYHYFPTKRDLLLYGLDTDARDRLCVEFREAVATFASWRPDDAIDAYLRHSREMLAFVRPSREQRSNLVSQNCKTGSTRGSVATSRNSPRRFATSRLI